jgi:hypothetical protein
MVKQTNDEILKQKIWEHLELIKYSTKSISESPDRATKFLIMQAILVDEKRKSEEDKVKLTTLVEASFSEAVGKASGGITEKKLSAERDLSYIEAREALGECEAKISWLKSYVEIFNNGHICYRGLMRESL